MGVVGAFPLLSDLNRRTQRAAVNPMDKSTVISIYPKVIHEKKITVQPGTFEIPAGTYEKPAFLVVGPSSWWKDVGENQPLLEISQSSIQMAESIVKDYCNGVYACDMGERMPGLFWIPGEINLEKLKKEFPGHLELANKKQRAWFEALVMVADSLWARTNGNSLAISDDMRLAANCLNLGKEWTKDNITKELVRCVACGSLKNPDYPVCSNCKAVTDKEKAKALGLTFAA